MKKPPHETVIIENGRSIPVWILDSNNLKVEIDSPPMTEGVTEYRGSIAVLYESGSNKYRSSAKNPQGRIHLLTIIEKD